MQTTVPATPALSPWWKHTVILVLVVGLGVLIWLTTRSYSHAPPIPETVVGPTGDVLFTADDIIGGQQVFLKYGLMDNGSIWGHGGYLGPDFSAAYLHHLTEDAHAWLAGPEGRYAEHGNVPDLLKENRFDPDTRALVFSAPEVNSFNSQPARHLAGLLHTPGTQPRASGRLHQRRRGTAASDRLFCPGRRGRPSPRGREPPPPTPTTFRTIRRQAIRRRENRFCGARSAW